MKTIYLAGGCFWGVEAFFAQAKGVLSVESGYANGNIENPTYKEVCEGIATHAEVVKVVYDELSLSLEKILELYFRIVNPHSLNKQGNDIGIQYRSGVYYQNEEDLEIINNYFNEKQNELKEKIVIEVLPLTNYYKAEEYHQNYLGKNPGGYCHIDLGLIKKDEKK